MKFDLNCIKNKICSFKFFKKCNFCRFHLDEAINDIIVEMEDTLYSYDDKDRLFFDKFTKLNLICHKEKNIDHNSYNKLIREINFLNWGIEIRTLKIRNNVYNIFFELNSFSNDWQNCLINRLNETENYFLKHYYSLMLFNLTGDRRYYGSYINFTFDLLHYLLENEEYFEDKYYKTISSIFVNLLQDDFFPKKKHSELYSLINQFLNNESIDYCFKNDIVYLCLKLSKFSKKEFENCNFEYLINENCNFAELPNSSPLQICALKCAKRLDNVRKNQNDKLWNERIAKKYKQLAYDNEQAVLKIIFLANSLYYFRNSGNDSESYQTSVELKNIQLRYFNHIFDSNHCFIHNNEYNLEFNNSFSLINFLIENNLSGLIPDSKLLDDFEENSLKSRLNIPTVKFDNLLNIMTHDFNLCKRKFQVSDNEDNQNFKSYLLYLMTFTQLNVDDLFLNSFKNEIFNFESVLDYLYSNYSYLNHIHGLKLLDIINCVLKEYFIQFKLFVHDEEYNFILFIDSMVSKIELLIRKYFEINCLKTVKDKGEGKSIGLLLNNFFDDEKFKEKISDDDYNFFKMVLLKEGLNLRNKSAHGLDLDIYSFSNANLVLLCFFRILRYFPSVNMENISMEYIRQNPNLIVEINKILLI